MATTSLSAGSTLAENGRVLESALLRSSGEVFCEQRRCLATVSIVRREGNKRSVCYVQWCSLRGIETGCSEDCIFRSTFAAVSLPSRPTQTR